MKLFWHRKLTLEIKILLFLTTRHYFYWQNTTVSFESCLPKINILQESYCILWTEIVSSCLKLSIILEKNFFEHVCWFLAKNLSNYIPNFVSLLWKLDNPYYHIDRLGIRAWSWFKSGNFANGLWIGCTLCYLDPFL